MADSALRLSGPTLLTAVAATIYTVPVSTTGILRNIHIANTTSVVVTFTMSIGADATGTRLFDQLSIPGRGVVDWSTFTVLEAGEILQAYAGTASVLALTVSGVEVQ